MTGLHTGHCFVRGNARLDLRPDDVTVAEVLKRAGYRTGIVGKWGLGAEGSNGVPTRQGFDSFFGYLDQHHAHNYYPSYLFRDEKRELLGNVVPGEGDFGRGVASVKKQYSHDLVTEEALAFLDRSAENGQPFFLYLAYTTPHANNEGGKDGMEVPDFGEYEKESWPTQEKGFAAMVSRMDRDIGRLFDRLEKLGIDKETVVFFSSDNGPHKEGGHKAEFFDSNGPLRGTKRDLYEGGIRVPTMVRWPGHVPAGEESHHVGYFGDFLATAAELAGVAAPEGLDGKSFVPAILGKTGSQPPHEFLYWEFYEKGSAQAVRAGKWKAVVKPMHGENVELYDLESDMG
jgi:arylsulfatase A-like enzyme